MAPSALWLRVSGCALLVAILASSVRAEYTWNGSDWVWTDEGQSGHADSGSGQGVSPTSQHGQRGGGGGGNRGSHDYDYDGSGDGSHRYPPDSDNERDPYYDSPPKHGDEESYVYRDEDYRDEDDIYIPNKDYPDNTYKNEDNLYDPPDNNPDRGHDRDYGRIDDDDEDVPWRNSDSHYNTEPDHVDKWNPSQTPSFFAQPGTLAAIVGGAVVGLLCAILCVMFVVYRMRKKDEARLVMHHHPDDQGTMIKAYPYPV